MHVQITLYASKSTSTLALETICFAAVGTAGNYFPTKLTVSTVSVATIGCAICHLSISLVHGTGTSSSVSLATFNLYPSDSEHRHIVWMSEQIASSC